MAKSFIQICQGQACLEPLSDNLIPIYEDCTCANADLALGCFATGQLIATPSCTDPVPLVGDALRIYTGAQQAGTIPVVGTVTNAYNSVYQSPMIWNPSTQFFCTPNVCVTSTVQADIINAGSTLVVNDAQITFNGTDNCPWDFSDGDIKYNGTSIIPDISCACAYACSIAECCGSCYFEGCFADCFTCCIDEWWNLHKGEVETTAQTDNNRLWIV